MCLCAGGGGDVGHRMCKGEGSVIVCLDGGRVSISYR